MSVVSLLDVKILNNPAPFGASYQFEITFEALENLQKDLEWKLTYVGSAQSSEHDQELDSLLVGPVPPGVNKFIFEADPPNTANIPSSEVLGVTVILLTCAYDGREFVRIGYYVNNEYTDESLAENPPAKPVIDKIKRNILAEKPRVTRFAIKWDSEATAPAEFPPDQPEVDNAPDDEEAYAADEPEVVEVEGAAEEEEVEGEDEEMGGVEKEDNVSEAGSEDIEDDSSEDDEEDEEEEGDEDMEMDEAGAADAAHKEHIEPAGQPADVMVH
ncbi:histone deposition protein Asf1 [Microthyrium microscopicum]|uniref:Histone chaperone n=1 Tax=Microthyrium microscopicum TaxID=703497 RepID=A0A6A6U830_9PEZI|nr:histone deposition protein Asf1 [Microthyrium microscopicum]